MLKSDLKTGMTVVLRKGKQLIVLRDTPADCDILMDDDGFMILDEYTEDLRDPQGDQEWDIVAVTSPVCAGHVLADRWYAQEVIWERPQDEVSSVLVDRMIRDIRDYADVGGITARELIVAIVKKFRAEGGE